jgi:hypothetical protein
MARTVFKCSTQHAAIEPSTTHHPVDAAAAERLATERGGGLIGLAEAALGDVHVAAAVGGSGRSLGAAACHGSRCCGMSWTVELRPKFPLANIVSS